MLDQSDPTPWQQDGDFCRIGSHNLKPSILRAASCHTLQPSQWIQTHSDLGLPGSNLSGIRPSRLHLRHSSFKPTHRPPKRFFIQVSRRSNLRSALICQVSQGILIAGPPGFMWKSRQAFEGRKTIQSDPRPDTLAGRSALKPFRAFQTSRHSDLTGCAHQSGF